MDPIALTGLSLNPFQDLQNGMASAWGIGTDIAGYILGFSFTFTTFLVLMWALRGRDDTGANNLVFVASAAIGIVFSTLVGWFPLWLPIFIGIILAFIVLNPFGGGGEG